MTNIEHCDKHLEMIAVGECIVCGKPICGDCSVSIDGQLYCADLSHQKIFNEYAKLLYTSTVFEMDLVAKNLELNGIETQWFNHQQYGISPGASLFVKKNEAVKAVDFLNKLNLLDFTTLKTYDW